VTVKANKDQAKHVFEANRPGWVNEMKAGDFIVAGRNFGMGLKSTSAYGAQRPLGWLCSRRLNQYAVFSQLRELRSIGARMSGRFGHV
jgi:hypothetical protein